MPAHRILTSRVAISRRAPPVAEPSGTLGFRVDANVVAGESHTLALDESQSRQAANQALPLHPAEARVSRAQPALSLVVLSESEPGRSRYARLSRKAAARFSLLGSDHRNTEPGKPSSRSTGRRSLLRSSTRAEDGCSDQFWRQAGRRAQTGTRHLVFRRLELLLVVPSLAEWEDVHVMPTANDEVASFFGCDQEQSLPNSMLDEVVRPQSVARARPQVKPKSTSRTASGSR